MHSPLKIQSLDKNDLLLRIENDTTVNSFFYEKLIRFCEINNKKLIKRIIQIWGLENSVEIYNKILEFFYKDVIDDDPNYWRSLNLLSKLVFLKEFTGSIDSSNRDIKTLVRSKLNIK